MTLPQPAYPRRIVIVGASLAGLRAAQAARKAGFDGEIVIVGDEPHLPYTRPPLSKQLLAGEHTVDRVELLNDEQGTTAAAFLAHAAAHFANRGVRIQRVLTDNGSCYRSRDFANSCAQLQITHSRTRPRRPQTNGKAERFIQTLLREWAYARLYTTSNERAATLPTWINHYNYRRPHGSLSHQPPATRLNNVLRNYN